MLKVGKVEKNIPAPEELYTRYPFRYMKKEESVVITVCEKDCYAYQKIHCAHKRVESRTGKKFTSRKISPTEYRVWRIE